MDRKKIGNILKGAAAAGALYGGANAAAGPDVVFAADFEAESAAAETEDAAQMAEADITGADETQAADNAVSASEIAPDQSAQELILVPYHELEPVEYIDASNETGADENTGSQAAANNEEEVVSEIDDAIESAGEKKVNPDKGETELNENQKTEAEEINKAEDKLEDLKAEAEDLDADNEEAADEKEVFEDSVDDLEEAGYKAVNAIIDADEANASADDAVNKLSDGTGSAAQAQAAVSDAQKAVANAESAVAQAQAAADTAEANAKAAQAKVDDAKADLINLLKDNGVGFTLTKDDSVIADSSSIVVVDVTDDDGNVTGHLFYTARTDDDGNVITDEEGNPVIGDEIGDIFEINIDRVHNSELTGNAGDAMNAAEAALEAARLDENAKKAAYQQAQTDLSARFTAFKEALNEKADADNELKAAKVEAQKAAETLENAENTVSKCEGDLNDKTEKYNESSAAYDKALKEYNDAYDKYEAAKRAEDEADDEMAEADDGLRAAKRELEEIKNKNEYLTWNQIKKDAEKKLKEAEKALNEADALKTAAEEALAKASDAVLEEKLASVEAAQKAYAEDGSESNAEALAVAMIKYQLYFNNTDYGISISDPVITWEPDESKSGYVPVTYTQTFTDGSTKTVTEYYNWKLDDNNELLVVKDVTTDLKVVDGRVFWVTKTTTTPSYEVAEGEWINGAPVTTVVISEDGKTITETTSGKVMSMKAAVTGDTAVNGESGKDADGNTVIYATKEEAQDAAKKNAQDKIIEREGAVKNTLNEDDSWQVQITAVTDETDTVYRQDADGNDLKDITGSVSIKEAESEFDAINRANIAYFVSLGYDEDSIEIDGGKDMARAAYNSDSANYKWVYRVTDTENGDSTIEITSTTTAVKSYEVYEQVNADIRSTTIYDNDSRATAARGMMEGYKKAVEDAFNGEYEIDEDTFVFDPATRICTATITEKDTDRKLEVKLEGLKLQKTYVGYSESDFLYWLSHDVFGISANRSKFGDRYTAYGTAKVSVKSTKWSSSGDITYSVTGAKVKGYTYAYSGTYGERENKPCINDEVLSTTTYDVKEVTHEDEKSQLIELMKNGAHFSTQSGIATYKNRYFAKLQNIQAAVKNAEASAVKAAENKDSAEKTLNEAVESIKAVNENIDRQEKIVQEKEKAYQAALKKDEEAESARNTARTDWIYAERRYENARDERNRDLKALEAAQQSRTDALEKLEEAAAGRKNADAREKKAVYEVHKASEVLNAASIELNKADDHSKEMREILRTAHSQTGSMEDLAANVEKAARRLHRLQAEADVDLTEFEFYKGVLESLKKEVQQEKADYDDINSRLQKILSDMSKDGRDTADDGAETVPGRINPYGAASVSNAGTNDASFAAAAAESSVVSGAVFENGIAPSTPLAVKADTDAQTVLGAVRAVNGSRAEDNAAVLGANRDAQTGDAANGVPYAAVMAGAAVAGAVAARKSQKEKK